MSQSAHVRRKQRTGEPAVSLLQPAPDPTPAPLSAPVSSASHTLGGFAIQRCGPVPCDCTENERAASEANSATGEERGHGRGHAAGSVQRAPDDMLPPSDDESRFTLGGDGAGDAIPLAGGANGSTTIHAPTLTYTAYSGQTLADVESQFPQEVGSVTFDFRVSTSGDPITSARLDVTQVMMMPRWLEYSRQCAPVQRAWDSFYSALRSHENGHVTIDNQQFAGKHARFIGKAQSDNQTESDGLRADVQAVQDAYDNSNQHGVTGNPPTILDTSVTCSPDRASADLSEFGLGEILASDDYGDTEQAVQAARADGGGSTLDRTSMAASVQRALDSGDGQPLDDDTRGFMEPRFGHDFSQVRVHTDAEAARSAASARALAYTVGSDIVFAAGSYAPQTDAGRHLLAHELTHVVQQAAGPVAGSSLGSGLTISDPSDSFEQAAEASALRVMSDQTTAPATAATSAPQAQRQMQRWTMPIVTLKTNAELLQDGANGDLQAIKEITDFSGATDDQRFSMIRTLLNQTWVGPRDEYALEAIWRSFGDRVIAMAGAHMDLWRQSADRGAELKETISQISPLTTKFPQDVKDVVSSYLFTNRQTTLQEMNRLGLPQDPNAPTPAPSAGQAGEMHNVQVAAAAVAKLQKAQEQARTINVGYRLNHVVHGDYMVDQYLPVTFDPFAAPECETAPPAGVGTHVLEVATTPYATVKEQYDKATAHITAWQALYPELYAISREGQSATTSAFAGMSPDQARQQLGIAMRALIGDIEGTQIKLDGGDLNPLDLIPIHSQLMHNQLLGGAHAPSGTNWADPVPSWVASELVKDHQFEEALKTLALQTIAQAAFMLAPFTGGASLLVMMAGLAATGIQAYRSAENYATLAQAAQTSVTPGTELVAPVQVNQAQMQAESDAAAFALAALAVGVAAAGEMLGAMRGPAGEVPPDEIPPGGTPPGGGGGPGNRPNNMRVTWQNLAEWEQIELAGPGGRVPRAIREGGHVLEKHVYITDDALQARAAVTGDRVATTFTDPDIAVQAINDVIGQNAGTIQAQIAAAPLGECEAFPLEATLGSDVGYGYRALPDGTTVRLDGLRTVQVWIQADGTGGWLVRTAFPIPPAAP